jgi:hypothetical protein
MYVCMCMCVYIHILLLLLLHKFIMRARSHQNVNLRCVNHIHTYMDCMHTFMHTYTGPKCKQTDGRIMSGGNMILQGVMVGGNGQGVMSQTQIVSVSI